jgi:hypothetical protein
LCARPENMPWEGPPDTLAADAKGLKCQQDKALDGYPRRRPRRRRQMKRAGDAPSPLRNTAPADANRITNERSRSPGLRGGDMADSIIRWPFLLPAFPDRLFCPALSCVRRPGSDCGASKRRRTCCIIRTADHTRPPCQAIGESRHSTAPLSPKGITLATALPTRPLRGGQRGHLLHALLPLEE